MPWLNACTFEEQQVLNKIPDQVDVQSIECLVDSTDALSFNEILKKGRFKKFDGPEIGYGHLRKNLWVKIVLQNKTQLKQEAVLSTDQIILESIEFYKKQQGGWQIKNAGWGKAIQNKDLPSYLHAFQISLAPGATETFYFKVRNQYQVVRLPLNLYSKSQFYIHYNYFLLYDGFVLMALVTAILYSIYNLFNSGIQERKTLVWYLIYAVNFIIFYSVRISAPAFFTEDHSVLLNYLIHISIFTSTYTFTRFGTLFIDPEQSYNNKKIAIFIDTFFALTILVSLFPSMADYPLFFYIKLIFFVSAILYLIYYLILCFRKSFLARIYFIMAMPLVISGLVEGLTNMFGILKVPNQFFEAFRISICVEMLFILFAMIFRERFFSKQIQAKLLQTELNMLETQISIQENEQKRIARDLHDDLGGTLASLKHFILSKISGKVSPDDEMKIRDLAQKSGDDLRRISHSLMPPDFERVGLVDSIKEMLRNNHSEKISFEFIEQCPNLDLKPNVALNIYRILSELVQNIHKHSNASKVLVQLIQNQEDLTLMVEDNGKGFSQKNIYNGLGIKNMNVRAESIGGTLNIDSNSNGTTVILEIPYV